MPKISRKCSKLEGWVFFIKKLISLKVRRRTKRGSTVYGHFPTSNVGKRLKSNCIEKCNCIIKKPLSYGFQVGKCNDKA